MDKILAVYILDSPRNGTLYTGVTSDLPGQLAAGIVFTPECGGSESLEIIGKAFCEAAKEG